MKQVRNSKKSAGRRGFQDPLSGIMEFSRVHGVSHQFVRKVLAGDATSRPVLEKWRRWRADRSA
jgi:hypothetical protein